MFIYLLLIISTMILMYVSDILDTKLQTNLPLLEILTVLSVVCVIPVAVGWITPIVYMYLGAIGLGIIFYYLIVLTIVAVSRNHKRKELQTRIDTEDIIDNQAFNINELVNINELARENALWFTVQYPCGSWVGLGPELTSTDNNREVYKFDDIRYARIVARDVGGTIQVKTEDWFKYI